MRMASVRVHPLQECMMTVQRGNVVLQQAIDSFPFGSRMAMPKEFAFGGKLRRSPGSRLVESVCIDHRDNLE